MNVIDIIKSRKPKPHAREGILLNRRWKEIQAGLLFDLLISKMVADIEREMREPLDGVAMDEAQKARVRETY